MHRTSRPSKEGGDTTYNIISRMHAGSAYWIENDGGVGPELGPGGGGGGGGERGGGRKALSAAGGERTPFVALPDMDLSGSCSPILCVGCSEHPKGEDRGRGRTTSGRRRRIRTRPVTAAAVKVVVKGGDGDCDDDDDSDDGRPDGGRSGGEEEEGEEYDYVPGAADDEESWSRGLTPTLFWDNVDRLLNRRTYDDDYSSDRCKGDDKCRDDGHGNDDRDADEEGARRSGSGRTARADATDRVADEIAAGAGGEDEERYRGGGEGGGRDARGEEVEERRSSSSSTMTMTTSAGEGEGGGGRPDDPDDGGGVERPLPPGGKQRRAPGPATAATATTKRPLPPDGCNEIGTTGIFVGTRRSGRPPDCWDLYDAVLNVTAVEYDGMATLSRGGGGGAVERGGAGRRLYLQMPVKEGKRDRGELERWMAVGLAFVLMNAI